jgi:hypothetical protein
MAAISTSPSPTITETDNIAVAAARAEAEAATVAAVERVRLIASIDRVIADLRPERLELLEQIETLEHSQLFQRHRRPWWQRNGDAQKLLLIAIMIAIVGGLVSSITLHT